MAQAFSLRFLTAESRVRLRDIPCGICSGQSGTGTVFFSSESFNFPLSVPLYSSSPYVYINRWEKNRSVDASSLETHFIDTNNTISSKVSQRQFSYVLISPYLNYTVTYSQDLHTLW